MPNCLVSVDVGIRNLAVCVVSWEQPSDVEIQLWELFDVLGPASVSLPKISSGDEEGCCQNKLKKTGKACGKKGRRSGASSSSARFYCGLHDPKRKRSASDMQSRCAKLLDVGKSLLDSVDSILVSQELSPENLQIVIEQQSINSREMLMYSHLIFGLFVQHFHGQGASVSFVPAYNKLLVYDGPVIECTLKTPYARRKFMSKEHTRYILASESGLHAWRNKFATSKKQDDLGDSFLQGLYVIRGKRKDDVSVEGVLAPKRKRARRKAF